MYLTSYFLPSLLLGPLEAITTPAATRTAPISLVADILICGEPNMPNWSIIMLVIICPNDVRTTTIALPRCGKHTTLRTTIPKAHIEDNNGNIVTDVNIIKNHIQGKSLTMSGGALIGKAESRGDEKGYRLVVDFYTNNVSASYTFGYTGYLGTLEEVAK